MNNQQGEYSETSAPTKEGLQDSGRIYSSNKALSDDNNDSDKGIKTGKDSETNVGENFNVMKYDFSEYCIGTVAKNAEHDTNKHGIILEEGLYDGDVAEIYLGDGVGSVEKLKSSEGSDSNLSEMTNSFGPMEDTDIDLKSNNFSPKKRQEHLPSGYNSAPSSVGGIEDTVKSVNQSHCSNETRKRPLSPDGFIDNTSESKRVKSEPEVYLDHSVDTNGNKFDNSEGVIDLCPPVAIVAPLGFCEDIFIGDSASNKNLKDETNCAKNDISSILDSLDQDGDKSLSLFDSVFEKMKTDIIEGQSFKTLDEGKWTFDEKHSNDRQHILEAVKHDNSEDKNENQNMLKADKEESRRSEFKRANSVEHDIEDFEKVLNSVIAKASRFTKGDETIVHRFSNKQSISGIQSSLNHKQCKQPCNHVANSDLLRELLDQKTDTSDTQTKTRQEIDLSFLHSDLISGKGLSVSSDKILQTRTIDPRLASIPHVERVSNMNQMKADQDNSENTKTNQSVNYKPNASKLLEGDHISLAEQRRASVTLHHKVPSHAMQQSHQSNMLNEAHGEGTNIIKEAFDFATEITDLTNDESDNVLSQPANVPLSSRQQMSFQSSPRNGNYLNRNNYNQNLKIDPMQNHQILGNGRIQEMQTGNGLLTFAKPNGIQSPDSNLPPQLAGPFMNSHENLMSRPVDFRQQQDPTQRAALFSKRVDNMHSQGNGLLPANSELQSLKGSFDHMQNPNVLNSIQIKQMHAGSMDPFNNQSIAQRQNHSLMNHSVSSGYPTTVSQMSRSNMPDLGIHSQENIPNYRYESGMPMNHMNRTMIPPENNYPMGMQERIRAMNVQQWYRRRMQAQMNRPVTPQSQIIRPPYSQTQGMGSHMFAQGQGMGLHPNTQGQGMGVHPKIQGHRMGLHQNTQGQGMGVHPNTQGHGIGMHQSSQGRGLIMRNLQTFQGNGPNSQMIPPEQDVESRLRAMQAQVGHMNNTNATDNQRFQQHAFSQGQDQINDLRHMQYGQQMKQSNKMADPEGGSSVYMPRPISADGMVDSTKSQATPLGELSQQFDIKREAFNPSPVQDMFPFNI